MVITHNMLSQFTYSQLQKTNNKKAGIMEKLSSGYRINRSADDAAGLTIREKMRAQIRGLETSSRNVQDGISLVQTADGALSELQSIVQRQRELCVQAANGTYTKEDREYMQTEIDMLNEEINSITNDTNFNQVPLLNITDYSGASSGMTGSGNLLGLSVSSDGTFSFRTDKGYLPNAMDDNKILNFGSGQTSYPQVYIDGTSYLLRSGQAGVSVTAPTVYDAGTNSYKTEYTVDGDIKVTQTITITDMNDLNGSDPANDNMYEIQYDVVNTGSDTRSIGILFNLDTMLGDDDFAPFRINGTNLSNEKVYTTGNIPTEFTVYNNKSNPFLKAYGILTGDGILEDPDQFGVGTWLQVDKWNWTPNGTIGDSAYSLWWNPIDVAANGNRAVNTIYGVSQPTAEEISDGLNYVGQGINLQVGANSGQIFQILRKSVTAESIGTYAIYTDPAERAMQSITKADSALNILSGERSKYGAYQNVLEHISNNILNYSENLTAAESRISDEDIADGIIENARLSILQQASQAMLAQANQIPQTVLDLLK